MFVPASVILSIGFFPLVALAPYPHAHAEYPERPIRYIVPSAAGIATRVGVRGAGADLVDGKVAYDAGKINLVVRRKGV